MVFELYRDNGKENGSYYIGLYRGNIQEEKGPEQEQKNKPIFWTLKALCLARSNGPSRANPRACAARRAGGGREGDPSIQG